MLERNDRWGLVPRNSGRSLQFVLIAYIVLAAGPLDAETAHREGTEILFSAGWRSTWVAGTEYSRALFPRTAPLTPVELSWKSRLTLPLFVENFLSGGQVETGLTALLRSPVPAGFLSGWGLEGEALTGVLWSGDDLGRRLSWGAQTRAAAGWFGEGFTCAVEAGWRGALLTRFEHGESVRRLFEDRFPGDPGETPQSGLSALTSQRLHLGFRTGISLSGIKLELRGGLEHTPSIVPGGGEPPTFTLPFYAELGGGLSW